MKLTRIAHLDGDPGVEQTISWMREMIRQGKQDPGVHELALSILTKAAVPAYDWRGEARAIFNAVLRNMRFTRDVHGNETLHAAPDLMRMKAGDCDDFTILMLSLAQSVGFPGRILTIATDAPWLGPSSIPAEAPEFCHVYPEVEIDGRWVALDAARQHPAFGKSPERFTRKRWWALDSEEYADMAGPRMNIAPGQGPQGAWRASVIPQFRVAASGMGLGTYLKEFPVAPPHQQFHRPPLGFGNYGVPAARRALKGLGDDGFDWSSLATDITAATTGAANIITAQRGIFPASTGMPGQRLPVSTMPYGTPSSLLPTGSIGGISSTTLLLGGGLLLLVVMAGKH